MWFEILMEIVTVMVVCFEAVVLFGLGILALFGDEF